MALAGGLEGHASLVVCTEALNQVAELQGESNKASSPVGIEVAIPFADLVVEAVSRPDGMVGKFRRPS